MAWDRFKANHAHSMTLPIGGQIQCNADNNCTTQYTLNEPGINEIQWRLR